MREAVDICSAGMAETPRGSARRRSAALIGAALAVLFCAAPAARAQEVTRYCHAGAGHPAEQPWVCVDLGSYRSDLCRAIESYATQNRLPPDFFARLIWRESRFDPNAVSPAGAQGVAQFIPGTARLRGLANVFNPSEALAASARYLRALADEFGNLGLAAAAYNGGENRMRRMLAENSASAPGETERYVHAITGYSIADWMRDPPREADYRLDAEQPFQDACLALAETSRIRRFEPAAPTAKPWGVQMAVHLSRGVVQAMFARTQPLLPASLRREAPSITRLRNPALGGRSQYSVQFGRDDRREAQLLCLSLRRSGLNCTVVKN